MPIPEAVNLSGQIVRGYEIKGLISEGGAGAVYRAFQPTVEREVAIKILLPKYANDSDFIRRFDAEAHIIARLEHPHIVPLYDYWREPNNAYLVMRWLSGGSLRNMLDQGGALPVGAISPILDHIALALTAAHHKQIIHRDIKPDNILLDAGHNAYLSDFGIARDLISRDSSAADRDRFGTPAYMSPEHILERPFTPQSDIYSLGVVLYELLTGRPPFIGTSYTEVMQQHVHTNLPPLQVFRSNLPHRLNMVIRRATAKEPSERYQSALKLADDFRDIAQKDGTLEAPAIRIAPGSSGEKTQPLFANTIAIEVEPVNPYKGLRPFQEADAQDFFGRDRLIERLLRRFLLMSNTSDQGENPNFLAVVGPSGSGKSSVVSAGLLPKLRRGAISNSGQWFYVQMAPGKEPFTELAEALLRIATEPDESLADQLRGGQQTLHETVKKFLPDSEARLVLVIDQFEELFTQVNDESRRRRFIDNLQGAITAPDAQVIVIVTLRADFYDRPLLYSDFGELARQCTEVVVSMTASEIEQAIISPAKAQSLEFEDELVTTIIWDVTTQPGALPLLQYALTELFEHREGNRLTYAAYRAIRGVTGALAQRADELYNQLDDPSKTAARRVFLRLVTPQDTRQRALQSDLLSLHGEKQRIQQLLDLFGKYRLLTFDHEPVSRAPTVELAHEALIREWRQLCAWIDSSRENLLLRQRLSAAVADWEGSQRDSGFLASGTRLAQFETLLTADDIALTDAERAYLDTSINARRQTILRRRLGIAALIILSVVALALAAVASSQRAIANDERDRANQQARISRSRELAVTALTNRDQIDLSLLLSLEALTIADTYEARNSLLTVLQSQPQVTRILHGHGDWVRSLAYHPDTNVLASGSRDHTIQLWDGDSWQPLHEPLTGHTDWVNSVAFSPDGSLLASASADNSARLWDVATGQPVGEPFLGHNDAVWAVAFNPAHPTGQLASAGADGSIILWDVAIGEPLLDPIEGHDGDVFTLAFSPDGTMLATGGADNTVRLWDVESGEAMSEPLALHDNWVLSVQFSPDGQVLASAGADRAIVFWDVATGQSIGQLQTGHTAWIRSLVFSPDGRFLVSGSADNTVRLWDIVTGVAVGAPLRAHTDAVWSLQFVPSQNAPGESLGLVSAGADNRIILWDFSTQSTFTQFTAATDTPLLAVDFSADGSRVAAGGGVITGGSEDNPIYVWNANSPETATVLDEHDSTVMAVAFNPADDSLFSAALDGTVRRWQLDGDTPTSSTLFAQNDRSLMSLAISPDGQIIAAGDEVGYILLWDASDGTPLAERFEAHQAAVTSLEFSPDSRLASGSEDDTIRLWDIESFQPIGAPLTGHQNTVASLAFSPDGDTLISGSHDGTLLVWNLTTTLPAARQLGEHNGEVWQVAISPDGHTAASGGQDNLIRLWDITTRQALGLPFAVHSNWVMGLAFQPGGQMMASVSRDRSLILWNMNLNSWRQRACQIANRDFMADERARYFADGDFQATCAQ